MSMKKLLMLLIVVALSMPYAMAQSSGVTLAGVINGLNGRCLSFI